MSEKSLIKIRIDLPQHYATNGESFWAEELGDGLYRLCNVPFYAYGLNFYDVVRAVTDDPEIVPEICEVIGPSGHKTLRIVFNKDVTREAQVNLLDQLKKYKAYYERADNIYVAVDIEAEGSFNNTYDKIKEWEDEGLLSFETC